MTDRPWVAEWRSNLHGFNEREGARFATREVAEARADEMRNEGAWDVRVIYAPVLTAKEPLRYRNSSDAKETSHPPRNSGMSSKSDSATPRNATITVALAPDQFDNDDGWRP